MSKIDNLVNDMEDASIKLVDLLSKNKVMVSIVNIGILLTYALIAIGALIAISFGVLKLFSRSGNSKKLSSG